MATTTVHLEAFVDQEPPSFWAVCGHVQSVGRTPGEALDRLLQQFPDARTEPLIVLPRNRPDTFFGAAQQLRLRQLAEAKHGRALSSTEVQELAELIDIELAASGKRAEAWYRALRP